MMKLQLSLKDAIAAANAFAVSWYAAVLAEPQRQNDILRVWRWNGFVHPRRLEMTPRGKRLFKFARPKAQRGQR